MSKIFQLNNVIKTDNSYLGYKLLVFGFYVKPGWRLININGLDSTSVPTHPIPGIFGSGTFSTNDISSFNPTLTTDHLNNLYEAMENSGSLSTYHQGSLDIPRNLLAYTLPFDTPLASVEYWYKSWTYWLLVCKVNTLGMPIVSGEGSNGIYKGLHSTVNLLINDDGMSAGELQLCSGKLWGLSTKTNCVDAIGPISFPSPMNYT